MYTSKIDRNDVPKLMLIVLLMMMTSLTSVYVVTNSHHTDTSVVIVPEKIINVCKPLVIKRLEPKPMALARVTYYTKDEDSYSSNLETSTGVRLHYGVCSVDPNKIPFYKRVHLVGIGTFRALDSGTAVITRKAARLAAHNSSERNALVVDVYCSSAEQARHMEENNPPYVPVYWD